MHQFEENHPEFKGFSERYEQFVRPTLKARDAARKKAVRNSFIVGSLLAMLISAVGAYLFFVLDETLFGVMIWAAAIASMWVVFALMTDDIRSETKDRIVGAVTDHIGWTFETTVPMFDLTPYLVHYLLPKSHDRASFEDRMFGQAHGARFESVEAHLEKRSRDSDGDEKWKTVFRGQLMRIDFPTKTFGRTVVLRDKGWFNAKTQGDMKRVGLVDPVFEKAFEAYGTDQVEARVILDPVFMQRMVDLEHSVDGKKIRFAFVDNDLFIAVETGDRYEAGSMFKPLDAPERTQKILDEIGAIYDIVDGLVSK